MSDAQSGSGSRLGFLLESLTERVPHARSAVLLSSDGRRPLPMATTATARTCWPRSRQPVLHQSRGREEADRQRRRAAGDRRA